jgi:hypothetical protein
VSDALLRAKGWYHRELLAGKLLRIAGVLWLVSLLAPVFMVYDGGNFGSEVTYWGAGVLLFGPLFGWASGGWAAYANVLFLWLLVRDDQGEGEALVALAMLALLMTLPAFRGTPGGPTWGEHAVASWGWGAIVWAAAICTMAFSRLLRYGWLSLQVTGALLVALGLSGLCAVGYGLYQRAVAGNLERQLFLPWTAAFTVEPLCRVDVTTVSQPLVAPQQGVRLELDPALGGTEQWVPDIGLPALRRLQVGQSAWQSRALPLGWAGHSMLVSEVPPQDSMVLAVRRTDEGARIQISNPAGQVVYQQRLVRQASGHGYCPAQRALALGTRSGVAPQLELALRQAEPASWLGREFMDEMLLPVCPLGELRQMDGFSVRNWDGRNVVLDDSASRKDLGFCSASYAALVSVQLATSPPGLIYSVAVFERTQLQPIRRVVSRRACSEADCVAKALASLSGVRVNGATISLKSPEGWIGSDADAGTVGEAR